MATWRRTPLDASLESDLRYSFSWAPTKACYIPVRAPEGDVCLDPVKTLETLRPILENPNIEKIGQNLKYDMVVLRSAGCEMQGVTFDTMVAHYLLEAGALYYKLKQYETSFIYLEKLMALKGRSQDYLPTIEHNQEEGIGLYKRVMNRLN